MSYHTNPWLNTAMGNTANPNTDYQSYLAGRGVTVDPSIVGEFFGGITEDYQEDIGMARAGLAQGMQGAQMQGQQAAMQLGGGQGLASVGGGGFGAQGYGMQRGLQGIGQQYGQNLQAGLLGYTQSALTAQRGMESQFMDVATGLFGRDAEGISWGSTSAGGGGGGGTPPSGWTGGTPTEDGTRHTDDQGTDWIWLTSRGWMEDTGGGG